MGAAADGFFAVAEFDVAGVDAAADRMDAVTSQLLTEAPEPEATLSDYTGHAAECRG